jgi:hypothetical protein
MVGIYCEYARNGGNYLQIEAKRIRLSFNGLAMISKKGD